MDEASLLNDLFIGKYNKFFIVCIVNKKGNVKEFEGELVQYRKIIDSSFVESSLVI